MTPLLLSLPSVLPAAQALPVPLRAVHVEKVEPGERPVLEGTKVTASVGVSREGASTCLPTTGDDLTVDKHEAVGRGSLSFAADPADTLRTWEVHLLDASGAAIAKVEEVDVLFDDAGVGTMVARGDGGLIEELVVQAAVDGTAKVKVRVKDQATQAAYIGLAELLTDDKSSALATDPDLSVMDAATYAAFQALLLDSIVPLTTFRTRVSGEVEVADEALKVDDRGVVEDGADLSWDVWLSTGTACSEDADGTLVCKTDAGAFASYLAPIGTLKKRTGAAKRVALKPKNVDVETWESSLSLRLPGDRAQLELGATVAAVDADGESTETLEALALDAAAVSVRAQTRASAAWSGDPVTVTAKSDDGTLTATFACAMDATDRTLAGTSKNAVYVGQCTTDDGLELRRVRLAVQPDGTETWTVDLAGAALLDQVAAAKADCATLDDGTTDCVATSTGARTGTVSVSDSRGQTLGKAAYAVEETWFQLDVAFATDVDGDDLDLVVKLEDPDHPDLTWAPADTGELVATTPDGKEVHRIDTDDVDVQGTGAMRVQADSAAADAGFLRISGRLKRRGGGGGSAFSSCSEFRLAPGGGGGLGTSACMEVGRAAGGGGTTTTLGSTACMQVR
jgi:hypothetical protein